MRLCWARKRSSVSRLRCAGGMRRTTSPVSARVNWRLYATRTLSGSSKRTVTNQSQLPSLTRAPLRTQQYRRTTIAVSCRPSLACEHGLEEQNIFRRASFRLRRRCTTWCVRRANAVRFCSHSPRRQHVFLWCSIEQRVRGFCRNSVGYTGRKPFVYCWDACSSSHGTLFRITSQIVIRVQVKCQDCDGLGNVKSTTIRCSKCKGWGRFKVDKTVTVKVRVERGFGK